MGAVFCRRSVLTLALEQEKVLGNSMLQLNYGVIATFRIEGVYGGMALYDNAKVVLLRICLIPRRTSVRERNHRGGWVYHL